MIYDFLYENLNFLYENLNFLYEILRSSLWKILMIFSMIFWAIHKISNYKVRVSTGSIETRWLGGNFLMVYRNNAGRLSSGFISVYLDSLAGSKKRFLCAGTTLYYVGCEHPYHHLIPNRFSGCLATYNGRPTFFLIAQFLVSFFLSWVANTQLHNWTNKQSLRPHAINWVFTTHPGPLPT